MPEASGAQLVLDLTISRIIKEITMVSQGQQAWWEANRIETFGQFFAVEKTIGSLPCSASVSLHLRTDYETSYSQAG